MSTKVINIIIMLWVRKILALLAEKRELVCGTAKCAKMCVGFNF